MMTRIAHLAIEGEVVRLRDAPVANALCAQRARASALLGLEDELVELLFTALSRLVEDELKLAPEHVRAVAKKELERLARQERAVLRVHPDDVVHVTSLIEESAIDILTVEADSELARGDCVLLSELGSVDARMQTKLERLRALILEGQTR